MSYTLYNHHHKSEEDCSIIRRALWTEGYINCLSFDPARKNLCLHIEKRFISNENKTIKIETLCFKRANIISVEESSKDSTIYKNISDLFDQYKNLIISCHILVLERQLPKNYKAVRVSQHVLSYLMLLTRDLPHLPMIVEVSSTMKTKMLKATKGLSNAQTKKWSTIFGKLLSKINNDTAALDFLEKVEKRKIKIDDPCDTIVQLEAFLININYYPSINQNKIDELSEQVNSFFNNVVKNKA